MRATIALVTLLSLLVIIPTGFATALPAPSTHPPSTPKASNPGWTVLCTVCQNASQSATIAGLQYAAMAYDAVDGYVVLFGGWSPSQGGNYVSGDTWVYRAGSWTKFAVQAGGGQCNYLLSGSEGPCPGPAEGAAMVWDATDNYDVLYGGTTWSGPVGGIANAAEGNQNPNCNGYNWIPLSGDTWMFSNGQWSKGVSGPYQTAFESMAYDPALGAVVMGGGIGNTADQPSGCGGAGATGSPGHMIQFGFNPLQLYHGGSWTTQNSANGNGPTTVYGAAMAFYPAENQLVLDGGAHISITACPSGCGLSWSYYGDSWVWQGGQSSNGWVDSGSQADNNNNDYGTMVFDGASGQLLMIDGWSGSNDLSFADQWNGQSWDDTGSNGGPGNVNLPATQGSVAAYDEVDGSVVLIPGNTGGYAETLLWPPPVSGSISNYPTAIDAGAGFSATVSISSPMATQQGWGYILNWTSSGNPASTCAWGFTAIGGSSQAQASCHAPGKSGAYRLELTLTIGNSQPALASQSVVVWSNSVTVYPPLTVSLVSSLNPAWVEVGNTIYLNASANGGDQPYSYVWTNLSCSNVNGNPGVPDVACAAMSPGRYHVVLVVSDPSGASTSSWVNVTVYAPLSVSKPNWANQDIDSGAQVTVSATVSGGYPDPSARVFNWSGLPTGCANGNTAQETCQPTAVSSPYQTNICFNVSDPSGTAGVCGYVTVEPPLSLVSYVSNRSSVDGNQWVGFTVTVSGGTGSYSGTSWSVSDVSTGASISCDGNHYVNSSKQSTISTGCQAPNALSNQTLRADVSATDGSLNGVKVGTISMPIYPDPYVTQSNASNYNVYSNKTVYLFGAAAMGTGTYSYAWTGLPPGCASQDVSVLACTPNVTKWPTGVHSILYHIYLWINDSNGYPASWNGASDSQSIKHPIALTVNKDPFLYVKNPPGVDVGQPVSFQLVYNGAYGTLTGVTWSGLPPGFGCTNVFNKYSAWENCTAASAIGPYVVTVGVTEQSGSNTTYGWLNVSSDPVIGTISVPAGQTVGQTATFTLSGASGGLLPYVFDWTLSSIGCANQVTGNRTLVISCVPTISGKQTVSVYAVDGNGWQSNIASAFVTLGAIPTVSITPNPTLTDSGLYTLFTSTVSAGSFNYAWKLTPAAACTPAGSVTYQNCTWNTPGTYDINLTLTNTAGYVTSDNISYSVSSDPSAYLKENRSYLDLGQSVKFTTVVAGGLTPYTFAWNNLPGGCTSANQSSIICTPSMSGNFSVTTRVNDILGLGAVTNYVNFTVVGGPTLSKPVPTRASIDDGQAVNFTAFVSNSSGNDVYAWSGLPTATCPASSASTVHCSYLVAGTYHVAAAVTDSNGQSALSPVLQYTVLQDPTVRLTGPTGLVDASEPVLITATAANGTGIYHYAWTTTSPMSCPNVDTPKDLCTASSAGTGGVTVLVSDSNGGTTSASVSVTANSALSMNITIASSGSTIPLNQSTFLTGKVLSVKAGTPIWINGSVSGGSPPYHLAATVNGSVVSKNSNLSSLSASTALGRVGTYAVFFNVTDNASTVAVQGDVQVLGVPVSVTLGIPVAVNASEPVNVTANVNGGVGPFSYFWAVQAGNFSNGKANETTATSTATVSWSSSGHYNISVTVTDGQGMRAGARTVVAVGKSPLIVSWSARSPMDQNASQNVSVTVTGGIAPYAFSWYQQTGPLPVNHRYWNTTVNHTFLTWFVTGTFNASVTVTDAHGASGTIAGVFVVGSGMSVSCAPTESGSLSVGNVVTFSLPCSPHGGIPPYTYSWDLISGSNPDATPFATGTGMTFNHTFQSAGSYLVIAWVQDTTHVGGVQAPAGSFHISAVGGSGGLGSILGSSLFWVILIPVLALVAFLLVTFLVTRRKRGMRSKQQLVKPVASGAELSPLQWAILEHLDAHPLEEQDRLTMAVGASQGVDPGEVRSAIGLLGPMGLLDSRQNVEDKETRYELTESGKKLLTKHRSGSTTPGSDVRVDSTAIPGVTKLEKVPETSTPDTASSEPRIESKKDEVSTPPKADAGSPSGHKVLGEQRQSTDEANPYKGKVKPEDVNPQLAGKKTIPAELLQPMELQQVQNRGTVERAPTGGSGIDYEAKARELEAKKKGEPTPTESPPKRGRLRDHLHRQKEEGTDGKS